jgi:hypothetical protein
MWVGALHNHRAPFYQPVSFKLEITVVCSFPTKVYVHLSKFLKKRIEPNAEERVGW